MYSLIPIQVDWFPREQTETTELFFCPGVNQLNLNHATGFCSVSNLEVGAL